MAQLCPVCQAENKDSARFCDQCTAPLGEAAATARPGSPPVASGLPAAQPVRGNTSWMGLIVLLLLLGGAGWLFYKPGAGQSPAVAGGETSANAVMQDAQAQIAAAKDKLSQNPLDIEALSQLYVLYGQVGQSEKVRPLLDKALAAWTKAHPEPSKQDLGNLAGISMAALDGNDYDAAIDTLELYYTHTPGSLTLSLMLGNLSRDAGQPERAIRWYDEYLKTARPETQQTDYWGAVAKRARMQLELAKTSKDVQLVSQAVRDLEKMTAAAPKLWQGWHALGLAQLAGGEKDKARASFAKAEAAATDAHDKWEVQVELAKLDGKAPPEEPFDHSTMGGMGNPHGDVASPHGGMGSPHGGMENPHGGMENPHGGMTTPPGTANPHGGSGA